MSPWTSICFLSLFTTFEPQVKQICYTWMICGGGHSTVTIRNCPTRASAHFRLPRSDPYSESRWNECNFMAFLCYKRFGIRLQILRTFWSSISFNKTWLTSLKFIQECWNRLLWNLRSYSLTIPIVYRLLYRFPTAYRL